MFLDHKLFIMDNREANKTSYTTNSSYEVPATGTSTTDASNLKRKSTTSTTAVNVSPSSSSADKRSRRDKDEDFHLDLCDKEIGEDESTLLHPFPFHGMNILFRNKYQPNGIDPR